MRMGRCLRVVCWWRRETLLRSVSLAAISLLGWGIPLVVAFVAVTAFAVVARHSCGWT